MFLDDYLEAVRGMEKHLVGLSIPNHFTYVGELLQGSTPSAKMVSCETVHVENIARADLNDMSCY